MRNFLAAILVSWGAAATSAGVINVPVDFPLVQIAIDNSNSGDTIIADDGNYIERINFRGKAIVVGSNYLLDGDTLHIINTVLDGNAGILGTGDSGSVVTFASSEGPGSELCGVTIQNGIGTARVMSIGNALVGGGVYCDGTSPVIRSCIIKNNIVEDFGGGLFSINGGPVIEDCLFELNRSFGSGGGICLYAPGNAEIIACKFNENQAFQGGGVYTAFNTASITSSSFERNRGIFGGALAFEASQSTVSDCSICKNSAISGGGVYCTQGADIIMSNIELVDNFVLSAPAIGGAIYCLTSSPLIINCTIVGNLADTGSAIYAIDSSLPSISNSIIAFSKGAAPVFCFDASTALFQCSNVYGNAVGDWVGCIFGQDFKDGNFSENPQFCQVNSQDYTLKSNSPCLPAFNSCGELIGARDMGCTGTEVTERSDLLPDGFSLSQNYPNPFNPTTRFDFDLPHKSHVNVSIYNSLGQLIRVLEDEILSAGTYTSQWDGRDESGHPIASGVYFYRFKTDGFTSTKGMILLK